MSDPKFYTTIIALHDDINGTKYLRITLSVGFYRTAVTAEIGSQVGWKMNNGVKVPDIDYHPVGHNLIEELNLRDLLPK